MGGMPQFHVYVYSFLQCEISKENKIRTHPKLQIALSFPIIQITWK